jgi:hypothetical protein
MHNVKYKFLTLSGSQVKPSSIGDGLSLDICGPYSLADIQGHRYFTLVVYANTLHRHVFLNKSKTELLTNFISLVTDYY